MVFIINADINNNDIGSGSLVGGSSYQVVKDLETITKAPTGRVVVPKHLTPQQPLLASLNMAPFAYQQTGAPQQTGIQDSAALAQTRLDSIAHADSLAAQARLDSTRNARKNRMNDARSNYNESLIYLGFTPRELTKLGLSANRAGNADTLVIFSNDLKPSRGEPYFILDRGGTVLYDSTLSSKALVDLASRINPSAGARLPKTDVSIGQGMEDSLRTIVEDYKRRDATHYRALEDSMRLLLGSTGEENWKDNETFIDDDYMVAITSLESIRGVLERTKKSGFRGEGFLERWNQHSDALGELKKNYESLREAAEKGLKDYINQTEGTSSVLSTETLEQIRQDSSEIDVKITQLDTLVKTIGEIEKYAKTNIRKAKGFPKHTKFMYSGDDPIRDVAEIPGIIYDELQSDFQDEPLLLESIVKNYLRPQAEFVLEKFESALKQYSYTEKSDRTIEGINLGEKESPDLIAEERGELEEAIGMLEDFLGTVSKPKRSWFRRDAPSIRTSYKAKEKKDRSERTHFALDGGFSMYDGFLGLQGNIGLSLVTPWGTSLDLGAMGVDGRLEEPFESMKPIYNKTTGVLLANFYEAGTEITEKMGNGGYIGLSQTIFKYFNIGGRFLFFPEELYTMKTSGEKNEWVVYHPSGIQEEMPTQQLPEIVTKQQMKLIQARVGFRIPIGSLGVGVVGGISYDLDTKEVSKGYLNFNVDLGR